MNGTVLITGGAGFVGSYVTRQLVADGRDVVVYDQQPYGNVLDLLPSMAVNRIHREGGEITDSLRLIDICKRRGVEAIVHLAAPLTKATVENPYTGIRDICLGTSTVFSLAAAIGAKKVVWTSSMAVFGKKNAYPPHPIADDAPHLPMDIYGSSKSLCEQLAQRAYEVDGTDVVGLRLSIVYGAGRIRGYMSYPSHLMREAAAGRNVHLEFGPQRLHWQYVEEIAAMVSTVLQSERNGQGKTYNCFGDSRSWGDAAAIIKHERPELDVTVGNAIDTVTDGFVDAFSTVGFEADFGAQRRWPLERGIAETLKIYEQIGSDNSRRDQ